MFRTIKLDNKDFEDHIVLMKSSREPYATIPNECVTTVNFNFQNVHEMHITVSKKDNPELYDKFIGKRQQIIYNDEERFVIEECSETKDDYGKAIKEIVAYSFDYTLDKKDEGFMEEGSYCLYNDGRDLENDKDGIINMFLEDNPHWAIGNITEAAMKEFCTRLETKTNIVTFNTYSQKVEKNQVIWSKVFTDVRPFDENSVMTLKFKYTTINIYNSVLDMLQRTESEIVHEDFINIPSPIHKITAEFSECDDYKNAIKYTIELSDGTNIIEYKNFLPVEGYKMTIDKIEMIYTTGQELEVFTHKTRSFDEESFQWRTFLRETIQTAYDVIFEFNNMAKIINCYATDEVGEHIGIKLSYDNFIKDINKTNEYENVVTKLIVESEKTSLHEANPLCTNYILDFTYFIENKLMSRDCEVAWYRYEKFVQDNQSKVNSAKSELLTLEKEFTVLSSKKKAYELEIKNLEVLRNTYMKVDDTVNVNRIAQEIAEKQEKLDAVNVKYESVNSEIDEKTTSIEKLIKSIQFENAKDSNGKIFDSLLLEELEDLIIVETIEDEYYETSKELYETYRYLLHEKNRLEISFETTIKNLLQSYIPPKNGEWKDKFKLGNFVDIDDRDVNMASDGKIRIVGYEYSPKNKRVDKIYFSNKDKKLDDLVRLLELGGDIKKNKGYAKKYKNTWKESRIVNQQVSEMLDSGIDIQKQKINGTVGRSLLRIEDAAMYVVDAEDENKQMYFGASMVASTSDNWKTYTKTLDEKGVNSGGIEGENILSGTYYITSKDKDLLLGLTNSKEGVGYRLQDMNTGNTRVFLGTEKDGDTRKARINISDSNGNEILNENGMLCVNSFTTSGNVGVNCPFKTMFVTDNEEIKSSKLVITLSPLETSVNITKTEGGINDTFTVSDNKVSITVPKHAHELDYNPKIVGGNPTNLAIKINGQTIQQNINKDISIDITAYVLKSGINEIEITSSTTGKITANIYNRTFITY